MKNLDIEKIIKEENELLLQHKERIRDIDLQLEEIINSDLFKKYLTLKKEKEEVIAKNNDETTDYYDEIGEKCNHPIYMTFSLDMIDDYLKCKNNCFCLICKKEFSFDEIDIKFLYYNKRLLADFKPYEKRYYLSDYFSLWLPARNIINETRMLYKEICENMEAMQGPCLPSAEEVLFDYIWYNKEENAKKVFTKIKNNIDDYEW